MYRGEVAACDIMRTPEQRRVRRVILDKQAVAASTGRWRRSLLYTGRVTGPHCGLGGVYGCSGMSECWVIGWCREGGEGRMASGDSPDPVSVV